MQFADVNGGQSFTNGAGQDLPLFDMFLVIDKICCCCAVPTVHGVQAPVTVYSQSTGHGNKFGQGNVFATQSAPPYVAARWYVNNSVCVPDPHVALHADKPLTTHTASRLHCAPGASHATVVLTNAGQGLPPTVGCTSTVAVDVITPSHCCEHTGNDQLTWQSHGGRFGQSRVNGAGHDFPLQDAA